MLTLFVSVEFDLSICFFSFHYFFPFWLEGRWEGVIGRVYFADRGRRSRTDILTKATATLYIYHPMGTYINAISRKNFQNLLTTLPILPFIKWITY